MKTNSTASQNEREWLTACLRRGQRERFSEIRPLTPSLGALLLERNNHNRPFRPRRAARYANAMVQGRWKLTPQGVSFDKNGVLLDGQHRGAAARDSGAAVPMTWWFGCDSSEFTVIDTGGGRTAGDMAAVEGFAHYNVRAAMAGHALRVQFKESRTFEPDIVLMKIKEMDGPVTDAALLAAQRARKMVTISAAGIAHWWIATNTKHGRAKLDAFWEGFVTGADLPAKSPILRLRNIFRKNDINVKNSRDRAIKEAGTIVLAWNAYVQGTAGTKMEWNFTISLPQVI